jgi:hypothetical protein
MRRPLVFVVSALVLLGSITLPASAQDFVTPIPNAACTNLGYFGVNNGQLMTCKNNGGSLTWHLETNFIAGGLCSAWTPGDTSTWAELQLFVNGKWVTQALPVAFTPGPRCDKTRANFSIPWIVLPTKVADGTKYRWIKGLSGKDGHGGKEYGKGYADPVFIYTKSSMKAKYLKIFRAVVSPVYGPSAYKAMMAKVQMPSATPTITQLATPAATPSPTPSPSASPAKAVFVPKIPITLPVVQSGAITFANAVSQSAMIPQTSWQRVQDVIASNGEVNIPITLVIGPNTQTTQDQITTLLRKEFRLFEGFSQPTSFTGLVYNGQDEAWAEKQVPTVLSAEKNSQLLAHFVNVIRNACDLTNPSGPVCGAGNAFMLSSSINVGAFYGVQEPFWNASGQNVGPMSQVDHEYTHNVQFSQWFGAPLKPEQNSVVEAAHSKMPCWFQEGQANAIGISVWAPVLQTYLNARRGSVARAINSNGPKPSLTTYTSEGFANFLYKQDPLTCYSPTSGDYQLGYSVGYAAVEALVAIGGPQSTMAILSKLAQGDNWSQAFEHVYGVSWKEGSNALGAILAAEYAVLPLGSGG